MFKTAMLVSALALSAPALAQNAQTAPSTPQTAASAQTAPTTPPAGEPVAAPSGDVSAATTAPATPESAPVERAAATSDAAQPAAAGATQIADVVGTEFPSYDKNSDKKLDKTEFGAWMVALKTASDPATKAGDPATKKWVDGAFASADTDKSRSVTQDELTKYLSQSA